MNAFKTVQDYATILARLRDRAEAHIAGGAVRDTILKKPIHDIDVLWATKRRVGRGPPALFPCLRKGRRVKEYSASPTRRCYG